MSAAMEAKKKKAATPSVQLVDVSAKQQLKWKVMTKEAREYTIKSMQQVMPIVLGRATTTYARRDILTYIQQITAQVKDESPKWRVLGAPSRRVLLDNRETHHKINVANKALEKKLAHESSQTRALQEELNATLARAEETRDAIAEYKGKIAELESSKTEVSPPTIPKVQVGWTEDSIQLSKQIVVEKDKQHAANGDLLGEGTSDHCQELTTNLRNAFIGAALEMRSTNDKLLPWIERLSAAKEQLLERD